MKNSFYRFLLYGFIVILFFVMLFSLWKPGKFVQQGVKLYPMIFYILLTIL